MYRTAPHETNPSSKKICPLNQKMMINEELSEVASLLLETEDFVITQGVRGGGALCPVLFLCQLCTAFRAHRRVFYVLPVCIRH